MAQPRDRLSRPQDIAADFARRRSSILGILHDEPESEPSPSRSPLGTTTMGTIRGGLVRDGLRTQRAGNGPQTGISGTPITGTGHAHYVHRSHVTAGRENVPPVGSARRGRGRVTNSVLPSWYPRTPLRDITAVVRAIERRRARFVEVEGQEIESLGTQGQRFLISSPSLSGAQLEHGISTVSPSPHGGKKSCPPVGKLPKILRDITNEAASGSESLTPQKKLLNSIDSVEKVVMEELQRLKRTPSAKRAEREKRVRTLKSMR
ncbi:hypothetical protein HS088_TW13G00213 [Tripterygium wilfordii]|uniref:Protein POLYCHOME n=1 Tax=Tripterygium wilfordii TaxID=458696 RepID=A0A7J7CTG7_TRIWF|nr:protein POLYCHOME-like [Tripterygium wilfordii]XP_038719267.1 protein POLYCHOME-like [Tripterygium wilfordii]XP_038719268.1 protein POLYCHOME-like [Tripterygium wilfordii]KAF5737334.1 hypothetical protein HS088_TW13G00213 [Tripterygium wilfordii]